MPQKARHSGLDTMKRFCSTCGKVVKVKPVAFMGQTIDGECVYEAVCGEKGHPFSVTFWGLSIVVSKEPLEIEDSSSKP